MKLFAYLKKEGNNNLWKLKNGDIGRGVSKFRKFVLRNILTGPKQRKNNIYYLNAAISTCISCFR